MSDAKDDVPKDDKHDAGMTDAEREMLRTLEDDAETDGTARESEGDAPEKPEKKGAGDEHAPVDEATDVHPVDMDPVKTVPPVAPNPDANLKLILDIPVEIKVEVGNSRLTIQEVLNLARGSIVELDRTAGSPADLIVNGTKVGQGDVVVVEESYGIRITKLVDPEERLNSL